jgi:hypothetical protein
MKLSNERAALIKNRIKNNLLCVRPDLCRDVDAVLRWTRCLMLMPSVLPNSSNKPEAYMTDSNQCGVSDPPLSESEACHQDPETKNELIHEFDHR